MSFLSAFIIDDELDSVELLQLQLQKYCPQIKTIDCFTSSTSAYQALQLKEPDIIFLDIEMPEMNGFQLIEKILPTKAGVIFITAYNQYAIKAFRFNAIDYLVKPVLATEIIDAVKKITKNISIGKEQLNNIKSQMQGDPINKIAVTTKNGIEFILLDDIVYAEACGNYSKLLLKDDAVFVISKTLKDIQELLEERWFLRIHRQYIVNLKMVKRFDRNECILTMDNKVELPVAKIQKDKLIAQFRNI